MPSRRSLLSCILAPAVLTGALGALDQASAGPAGPEFVGIDGWLNTDGPLTIVGLRGKVVLVEFCTYTCIYWRRTLPYVNRWHSEYGPRNLQIIGVHTPEFEFERVRASVESAIGLLGITYPIAQDNEFRTWNAWSNQAWPTFYLLDREGQVRLVREGEGHSREIEDAVRTLLGLGPVAWRHRTDDADRSRIGTPEIHFGSVYPTPQDLAQSPRQGESIYVFSRPGGPRLNEYELNGSWMRGQEALVLRSPNGGLRIRFSAAKFYLVAGSPQPMPVRVRVDGRTERSVVIGSPTLYTLLEGDRYGEHLLELDATTPGLSLYSATFG